MTAPVYPTAEVLFNLGEGVSELDLNNVQRFLRAQMFDLGRGMSRLDNTGNGYAPTMSEFQAYRAGLVGMPVAHAVGCAPYASAMSRVIKNLEGMLLQNHGEVNDGSRPGILAYYAAKDSISATIAVGDATNPRVDAIVYKLTEVVSDVADQEVRSYQASYGATPVDSTFIVRRKVTIDVQVFAGTPAAVTSTTPVPPSWTSGYVPWAFVYVPATFNAVVDVDNIQDMRVPMGHRQFMSYGIGGDVFSLTWLVNGAGYRKATGGGDIAYFLPSGLNAQADARLLSIECSGRLDGGAVIELVRIEFEPTAAGFTEVLLETLTTNFNNGTNVINSWTPGNAAPYRPWWMNGHNAGVATAYAPNAQPNNANSSVIAFKVTAGAATNWVKSVKWSCAVYAGG